MASKRPALLLASLLALPASAAEPPAPKAVVLKASRLFDAKSGKLVTPGQLDERLCCLTIERGASPTR